MNAAGPSRRTSTAPSPLKPRRERDIWGLGLSSDLIPDVNDHPISSSPRRQSLTSATSLTPSRQASLRRRAGPTTPAKGGPGQREGQEDQHPLFRTDSPPRRSEDSWAEVLSDVSRPNLTRLTSDLERRAGSSRGGGSEDGASRRDSGDRLRNGANGDGAETRNVEVEVLLHQVQPNESLAGIALLYGIDLATLRKTNKLWASDTVHLRRHLYVPLEACRWTNARETLIRGPGEGQVTLLPRHPVSEDKGKGKGKAKEESTGNLIDLTDAPVEATGYVHTGARTTEAGRYLEASSTGVGISAAAALEDFDPWSEDLTCNQRQPDRDGAGLTSPSGSFDTRSLSSAETARPPAAEGRTVDVVRIPASQLRFFPKPPRPGESTRTSLDSGPRSSSALRPLSMTTANTSPVKPPLSIQNDLHFSHNTPAPRKAGNSVRLRPPTSAPSSGTGLADKLSNLFYIPPPPAGGLAAPPLIPPPRTSRAPRMSLDSTGASVRSSPRAGRSAAGSPTRLAVDELELISRGNGDRRGSVDTFKVIRRGSNGERRKLD